MVRAVEGVERVKSVGSLLLKCVSLPVLFRLRGFRAAGRILAEAFAEILDAAGESGGILTNRIISPNHREYTRD